jgi:hypothetical protein
MLLYPLVVIADLLLWGFFIDVAKRSSDELVLWSLFGLALGFLIWAGHEGIRLATAKLEGAEGS